MASKKKFTIEITPAILQEMFADLPSAEVEDMFDSLESHREEIMEGVMELIESVVNESEDDDYDDFDDEGEEEDEDLDDDDE
jgi:hypothetical protein